MRTPSAAAFLAVCLAAPAAPGGYANPCEAAARIAAEETGVPLAILMAIARAESGRSPDGEPGSAPQPWPWTLNVDGRGEWFPSRALAAVRAEELRLSGHESFDVGCFQINTRWHGDAFPSLGAMFDPTANAMHAAGFLAELLRETGNWRAAAALYHSRDPDRAEAYARRLEALHAASSATGGDARAMPEPADTGFAASGATGPLLRPAMGPLIGGP